MREDPYRTKYYERMTPAAKRGLARRNNSMFRDSLGGDSSNYRL